MSETRPSRSLPPVPDLVQQKKQARELLDAARALDPMALQRFREYHPRLATASRDEFASRLALHDAQLVLAREYGFPSWPKLKTHIEERRLKSRTHPFVCEVAYFDDRARGLLAILPDGAPGPIEQVRAWHPAFGDAADEAIRAAAVSGAFTIDDARLVYARQHGHASWDDFTSTIRLLGSGDATDLFLDVFEAGRNGHWKQATALLRAHPDLVRARGTNGNTLLNLACSLVSCPAIMQQRRTRGGGPPMGGRGGGGFGGGRRPGGTMGGGRGGERSGGGGRGDFEQMRRVMETVMQPPAQFQLARDDSTVTIAYGGDRPDIHSLIDGKNRKSTVEGFGQIETKAKWGDHQLVVERKFERNLTVQDTYTLREGGEELDILTKVKGGRFMTGLEYHPVFDRTQS